MPRHTPHKQTSERDSWSTPPQVAKFWINRFNLRLDVAATAGNAKCSKFLTAEDDALSRTWDAPWWCNPPYTMISDFIKQAETSPHHGIMLLPARTDQAWFQHVVLSDKWSLYFARKRIDFVPANGIKKSGNNHCSVILGYKIGGPKVGSFNAKTGEIVYDADG